jgi:hypothetical protein
VQASTRVRRPVCLVLLTAQLLTACTSWKVHDTPPPEQFRQVPPSQVRLWLTDTLQVEMKNPGWVSDSITGTAKSATRHGIFDNTAQGKRVSVPAAGVTRYAVRKTSTVKTILLVVGVTAVALYALVTAYVSGME